ncbi:FAD-binding protein [Actinosynnema sp. NPDC047251]|uniref:Putative oxidoreductase n=1 Tax=Saccharothrix espanaensis (strain ATCC 51144 / DSM 44229 / JCM 9112 / NBRC 15066 / NRRL 15764) TaxID=1179773 RepID=K0JTQ1_SACES|nr:FAD-binding protein [Saccharothrix espanaensis]CCH29311.1 putative oxidoreductase [Saccharothrix espanaensis DSM 44229]
MPDPLAPFPPVRGVISTEEHDLRWASTDFGRAVHHRPLAVLRPDSVDDIAAVQRYATTHQLPLVPRAEGHSTSGQAQASGGIVVDMTGLDTVHRIGSDHLVVDAGARWSEVLAATIPHGLTPPVLTDYLELSVGGTLSVGGIGGTSHRHGAQTDNVLALDVLAPDGTRHTCSPTTNPLLFDAVRAGRGRQGVILTATLRLIRAHTHATVHRLRYDNLTDFLADQRTLMNEQRFDYLEGQAQPTETGPWALLIEAATFHSSPDQPDRALHGLRHHDADINTVPYLNFLDRLAESVALLRRIGPWQDPHPWLNLLLPDSDTENIVTTALATTTPELVGDSGLALLYPLPRARFTTPKLRLPQSTTSFLFSLLRAAPPASPATLARMVDHNHRLTTVATAAGGVAYLGDLDT